MIVEQHGVMCAYHVASSFDCTFIFPDSSVGRASDCELLQLFAERRIEKRGELSRFCL